MVLATLTQIRRYAGLGHQLRLSWVGLQDAVRMVRGQEPLMIGDGGPPRRAGGNDDGGFRAGHAGPSPGRPGKTR